MTLNESTGFKLQKSIECLILRRCLGCSPRNSLIPGGSEYIFAKCDMSQNEIIFTVSLELSFKNNEFYEYGVAVCLKWTGKRIKARS